MTIAEKENILENKKNKKVKKELIKKKIPTGSDILDIAMEGGWDVGGIAQIYADSTAGKTLFAIEAIYQALLAYSPEKTHYKYNDVEAGLSFDTEERYGYPLLGTKHLMHEPVVESLKSDILYFCDDINASKEEVGILVIDSQDLLYTLDDKTRTEDEMKAYKKDGEAKNIGTYGNRAKKIKEMWRHCAIPAYHHNLHVMVISQIIDKMNAMPFEKKTTTSGGHGTKFASSKKFEIKRVCDLGPKDRPYGYRVCVILEKTRTRYEGRKVYIDILTDSGFDNVRSNLIFLYDLLDERGREIPNKGNALKWGDVYDPKHDSEAEDVSNDDYKQFCDDMGIVDAVKDEYKRYSVPNIKKYISDHADIMTAFADKYGVTSLDDLCSYIERNDLEEELTNRVKMKWNYLEEKDKPKNRKVRPKVNM